MTETEKLSIRDKLQVALSQIRPYLMADGGDVEIVELTDDLTVKVILTGACQTCAMNVQTLKAGVEHTLKTAVPEIKEVVNVTNEINF